MAQKRFSKRVTRKTQHKLTPKDAETIMRKEFVDSHGNKHILKFKFEPQNPFKPDYTQTIEYKDK